VRELTALASGQGLNLTYGYDRVSQVTSITDPRPGGSQTFTYDAVNRLKTAGGPWGSITWTYDTAGNRMSETGAGTTTYDYDAGKRLILARGESFTYDAVGRLEKELSSDRTYGYSPRGLLAQVTAANLTAAYSFDPAGLRIARTVNGVTTYTARGAGGDAQRIRHRVLRRRRLGP
jgi:YD repeat-containing protein